jgi:hypothetical protein
MAFWMAHGLDGAMIGYLVNGFFVTVLYYPFFWVNLALAVALQASTRQALRAGNGGDPPIVTARA